MDTYIQCSERFILQFARFGSHIWASSRSNSRVLGLWPPVARPLFAATSVSLFIATLTSLFRLYIITPFICNVIQTGSIHGGYRSHTHKATPTSETRGRWFRKSHPWPLELRSRGPSLLPGAEVGHAHSTGMFQIPPALHAGYEGELSPAPAESQSRNRAQVCYTNYCLLSLIASILGCIYIRLQIVIGFGWVGLYL